MNEWPGAWSSDWTFYDGTVAHKCSECPEYGPCPRQGFVYKDIVDVFPPVEHICRVYWGSHGCALERGHKEPCVCDCCRCKPHDETSHEREGCVAAPPYYGPDTKFYGEDVKDRGLPGRD